jgi:FecR protein
MNIKTLRFFSWITLLAFLPVNVVFAAPSGQITQSSGYVAVSSAQAAPKAVGSGEPIEPGQTVTLGEDARAVLKFQDGQIVALQSKSIFKVNSYKYDQAAPEKGESFFSLLQGGLRAVTGLIGSSNKAGWKLASPTATIGIRGTDFMMVINQGVYLKVDAGAISATNSAGTAVFTAGQTAAVASGTALGTVVPASAIPAGTFGELSAINLSAVGGSAAGSAASAAGTVLGIPTSVLVGVGLAGAAAAAATNGHGDTTTHH